MAGYLVGVAAEFRKHEGAVGVGLQVELFEIDVLACNIAFFFDKPTRRCVPDSCGIKRFESLIVSVGIELPPALVEDRIVADRGVIIE